MPDPKVPTFFKEVESSLAYRKAEGSHEAIPPIPDIARHRLMSDLFLTAAELLVSQRRTRPD